MADSSQLRTLDGIVEMTRDTLSRLDQLESDMREAGGERGTNAVRNFVASLLEKKASMEERITKARELVTRLREERGEALKSFEEANRKIDALDLGRYASDIEKIAFLDGEIQTIREQITRIQEYNPYSAAEATELQGLEIYEKLLILKKLSFECHQAEERVAAANETARQAELRAQREEERARQIELEAAQQIARAQQIELEAAQRIAVANARAQQVELAAAQRIAVANTRAQQAEALLPATPPRNRY